VEGLIFWTAFTRRNFSRHMSCLGMSWIYSLCTSLLQYNLPHIWLEFWRRLLDHSAHLSMHSVVRY